MFEALNFIREEFMMRSALHFNEDKGGGDFLLFLYKYVFKSSGVTPYDLSSNAAVDTSLFSSFNAAI